MPALHFTALHGIPLHVWTTKLLGPPAPGHVRAHDKIVFVCTHCGLRVKKKLVRPDLMPSSKTLFVDGLVSMGRLEEFDRLMTLLQQELPLLDEKRRSCSERIVSQVMES